MPETTAAAITGEKWSAKTAVNGLLKKVSYLLFVIFAQLLDTVIIGLHTTGILNVENFRYFGLIVNVYLIGTEGMSIMKNLHDCGVPIPRAFTHFFDFITQVGEKDKRKEQTMGICKDIEKLGAVIKPRCKEMLKKLRSAGIRYTIVETLREHDVAYAYYLQGRRSLVEVNEARKVAGLYQLCEAENRNT